MPCAPEELRRACKIRTCALLGSGADRYPEGMNILQNLVWNARQALQIVLQLLGYAVTFLLALIQPKAVLTARLLAAESQLAVCKHRIQEKKDPRPRFTPDFRLLWVILSKCVDAWQAWTHLMQPATVNAGTTLRFTSAGDGNHGPNRAGPRSARRCDN